MITQPKRTRNFEPTPAPQYIDDRNISAPPPLSDDEWERQNARNAAWEAIFQAAVTVVLLPDQIVAWAPWTIRSRPTVTQERWEGLVTEIQFITQPTGERPQGKTTFVIKRTAPEAFIAMVTEVLLEQRPIRTDSSRGETRWEPESEIGHRAVQEALAHWRIVCQMHPLGGKRSTTPEPSTEAVRQDRLAAAIKTRANELKPLIVVNFGPNTVVMTAPWVGERMMEDIMPLFAEWGELTRRQCRIEFSPAGTRISICPDFPDFSEFIKEVHDILARAGAISWQI